MYLVLLFSFNSFRFDAEINVFAFLLTCNSLSSMLIQEHLSSNLDDRQASKAVLYHLGNLRLKISRSTILKFSFENLIRQKRSRIKFERFALTFCRNVGTFGANLCNLFPNIRIRHSKDGQETSKLGGHA